MTAPKHPRIMALLALPAFIAQGGACLAAQEGFATYYSVESCKKEGSWDRWGGKMANRKPFKDDLMICAMPWKPTNKAYLVCGPAGCAEVTHQDRGPCKESQKKGVVMDLTPRAFKQVCGDLKIGKCRIKYKELS